METKLKLTLGEIEILSKLLSIYILMGEFTVVYQLIGIVSNFTTDKIKLNQFEELRKKRRQLMELNAQIKTLELELENAEDFYNYEQYMTLRARRNCLGDELKTDFSSCFYTIMQILKNIGFLDEKPEFVGVYDATTYKRKSSRDELELFGEDI